MKIKKRIFHLFLVGSLVFVTSCASQKMGHSLETVSFSETDLIADLIFQNECSSKASRLLFWNEGENFPSLGIGHFIWYPVGYEGPFHESFPAFLSFFERNGHVLPKWFKDLPGRHAPWQTRKQFLEDLDNGELEFLRQFLIETKALQAEFIIHRFRLSISKIVEAASPDSRHDIKQKLSFMLHAKDGLYPLIDYVNFNGEGIFQTERYKGQGWGLLQVLEAMKMPLDENHAVLEFVNAINIILERRVDNSPPERNEIRWLPGWKNRIATYLTGESNTTFQMNYQLRQVLLAAISENVQIPINQTDFVDVTPTIPVSGVIN